MNERLLTALGFLEKLTSMPSIVGVGDAAALRAVGLSGEAISDLIHVCALLSIMNRIADALGFRAKVRQKAHVPPAWLREVPGSVGTSSRRTAADRFAGEWHDLTTAVLTTAGVVPVEVRSAIFSRGRQSVRSEAEAAGAVPSAFSSFVDKVVMHADDVADQDITALRRAGCSEDAIFEVVVTAAVGAGIGRVEQGLAALRGAEAESGGMTLVRDLR
ncbi:MAG: hypothetical protein ACT4P5_00880 [Armatimonadota bacterium]